VSPVIPATPNETLGMLPALPNNTAQTSSHAAVSGNESHPRAKTDAVNGTRTVSIRTPCTNSTAAATSTSSTRITRGMRRTVLMAASR
jgi:hypothetical protein